MGNRRTVTLWNLEGLAAIVCEASGVVYTNQTGGHVCLQDEVEGVLVPFNDDPPRDDPEQAVSRRLSRLLEGVTALTPALADDVDRELARHPWTRSATVNRELLAESHEAWVHVILNGAATDFLAGFGRCLAVLTWPNSD
jgi:hypothetical protein